ncbi:MAG: hypothetical protein ACRDTJ_03075 [Pseudonocardiaceae bacterium]
MEVVRPAVCLLASPALHHANAGATQLDQDLALKFTDPGDAKALSILNTFRKA